MCSPSTITNASGNWPRPSPTAPADTVILDLSALTMIDSAGIGMLIMANDRVIKRGKTLRLRGVTGHVAKVVELSRIEQLIPID